MRTSAVGLETFLATEIVCTCAELQVRQAHAIVVAAYVAAVHAERRLASVEKLRGHARGVYLLPTKNLILSK